MKSLASKVFSYEKFNIYIIVLFGLTFLSIPLCSFNAKLFIVTWALTILLLANIFVVLFFYKTLKVTSITICFFAFCITALFSSALTGFKSFSTTPILNTVLIISLYSYFITQESKQKRICLSSLYFSLILFSAIFMFIYRKDLLSLNFTRLGSAFGDENDISIIFTIGFAFSFFYLFNIPNVFSKIINIVFALIFTVLAFTGGSKISIVIIFLVGVFILFSFFGKKRWYISLLLTIGGLTIIIVILNLPPFETLKDRFLNMLYTFVGIKYKGLNPDSSTAGRLEMIINGFSLFLRRPLFGFGLDGYSTFSTHHSGWSHNHWSDSFCNYGLIGTFLYHLPFIIFFLKKPKEKSFFCTGVVLFFISTISIALFKEKMFAYSIGLFLSNADLKAKKEIELKKRFTKKEQEIFSPSDKKMKIVEMIPSLYPIGGAETFFTNLCEEFVSNYSDKVDLKIIILYDWVDNSLFKRINSLNIDVICLNKHTGIDFRCAKRLSRVLKDINPDLIHSHLGTSITLMLALRFRKKVPIVHTFHHMVGTGFKSERFNTFLIRKNKIIPVAVSKQSALSIESKTNMKCVHINNGININNYSFDKPIANRKNDFLCVASFTPVKNQSYLINIFKKYYDDLKQYRLVFVGDGSLRKQCIAEAKGLIENNVVFTGVIDNVNEFMADSKVLVLSSTTEGNPMVINEAIASGMYIISNNVGGIPDLIIDGKNGDLIEINDEEQFKKCMIKRIADTEFLESNRLKSVNIRQNYSISHSARQYHTLFLQILERPDLICTK